MIGNDETYGSILKATPQLFSILFFSYRRTAFEFCCSGRNFFGSKVKIVWTRLGCDLYSVSLSLTNHWNRVR